MNELKIGLILSATDKMSRVVDMAVGKSEKKLSKFQKATEKTGKSIQKMGTKMFLAGSAVAGALFAEVKSQSSAAAEYLRTSQKVGMSVENWQKVEYAAGRVNVASESLRVSLQRFSKTQVSAFNGNKTAQAAFKMVGVSILDHNKKLKSSHKMLLQIADAFSRAKNGPVKTAAAIMLFGKAGADMIPMLNNGSKGIKDFGDRADNFGNIMSGKDAQSMKGFALKMRTMKDATSGVTRMITIAALPAMMQLADFISITSERVVKWVRQNRSLVNTIVKVAGAIGGISMAAGAFLMTFGTVFRSITLGIEIFKALKFAIFAVTYYGSGLISTLKSATVVQWLFNTSLLGCPIVYIILIVGALTAAVIYAYKHFQGFRNLVDSVGNIIKKFGESTWGIIKKFGKSIVEFMLNPFSAVLKIITGLSTAMGDLLKGNFSKIIPDAKIGLYNAFSSGSATPSTTNNNVQSRSSRVVNQVRKARIQNSKSNRTQTIAYSPTISIGSGSQQDKQDFAKMLRAHKHELASLLKEMNNNNSRLSFEG